jgi:hypothetical protein
MKPSILKRFTADQIALAICILIQVIAIGLVIFLSYDSNWGE